MDDLRERDGGRASKDGAFGTGYPGDEALFAVALGFRERAYAPYSRFPVGAAVWTDRGRIVGGCNVENGSFGLTICAERNALSAAVAARAGRPLVVAVAGPEGVFCPPCGACRQFLAEFNPEATLILRKGGRLVRFSFDEILPNRFAFEAGEESQE
jgi:cytidine deaminase